MGLKTTEIFRIPSRKRLGYIKSENATNNQPHPPIYTKGKRVAEAGVETYYFLVSAKRAE